MLERDFLSQDQLNQLARELRPEIVKSAKRTFVKSGESGCSHSDAEDISQQVLLQMLTGARMLVSSWRPESGLSLVRFAGLVARRRTLDVLRRERVRRASDETRQEEIAADCDPQRELEQRELIAKVELALREQLSPLGLDMFARLYTRQQAVAEICQQTNLSQAAVYQWRTRLRKLLQGLIKDRVS